MAALTSTGVELHDYWYEVGTGTGANVKVVDVTLTLSSQGGLTNNIPASLFGMSRILKAEGFRDTSSVRREFGPNLSSTLVGTLLVAYDNTNATDAQRENPADITATVRGLVYGIDT